MYVDAIDGREEGDMGRKLELISVLYLMYLHSLLACDHIHDDVLSQLIGSLSTTPLQRALSSGMYSTVLWRFNYPIS
jgi:hypothetical protein